MVDYVFPNLNTFKAVISPHATMTHLFSEESARRDVEVEVGGGERVARVRVLRAPVRAAGAAGGGGAPARGDASAPGAAPPLCLGGGTRTLGRLRTARAQGAAVLRWLRGATQTRGTFVSCRQNKLV